MEINNLNPNDPLEREVGVWLFRLSTAHADKTNNLARHKRWLASKLRAAIQRATRQGESHRAEPQCTVEAAPISLEEAKARTAVLMASM